MPAPPSPPPEAGVERARRDLQRAEIVAPYAGRVRTKNVDIGQYVRVGDALATVYAVDIAEIRLPLPDDELAYLDLPLSYRGVEPQVQPLVTLRATFAGETHSWDGLIVRTESEIDAVSRMVHAVAEVPDPYAAGPIPNRPPLAVGMYVEAEISGRTARDVAVLPRQALRGRDQVLVVTPDDRISFRMIDVLRDLDRVRHRALGPAGGRAGGHLAARHADRRHARAVGRRGSGSAGAASSHRRRGPTASDSGSGRPGGRCSGHGGRRGRTARTRSRPGRRRTRAAPCTGRDTGGDAAG